MVYWSEWVVVTAGCKYDLEDADTLPQYRCLDVLKGWESDKCKEVGYVVECTCS